MTFATFPRSLTLNAESTNEIAIEATNSSIKISAVEKPSFFFERKNRPNSLRIFLRVLAFPNL